ncbi:hypothetical protein M5K25_028351 [Dendrobium thyrsiflorum]|uniref:Uncharacterized protein n=1 Tax=Dendrobium thyrsiflorum TaxID=117978 RepID=A0ABD0TTP3_DENTH
MEMTCRDRGSPPVRVVAVAPCLAPIERRNLAALQLLSFPSLLLEEIDKEKTSFYSVKAALPTSYLTYIKKVEGANPLLLFRVLLLLVWDWLLEERFSGNKLQFRLKRFRSSTSGPGSRAKPSRRGIGGSHDRDKDQASCVPNSEGKGAEQRRSFYLNQHAAESSQFGSPDQNLRKLGYLDSVPLESEIHPLSSLSSEQREGFSSVDPSCSCLVSFISEVVSTSLSSFLSPPSSVSEVVRIFTDMSISPSLSPRQCPDRYAFRAGRNLPDKEFRYLRTVRVTAAVHRGFGRRLPCHQVTNFLDLPALGRRQPPYMVPLVEGRSSFSWEYGMGYFSAVAPDQKYYVKSSGFPPPLSHSDPGSASPLFRDELLAPVLHFVSVDRGKKKGAPREEGCTMREARRDGTGGAVDENPLSGKGISRPGWEFELDNGMPTRSHESFESISKLTHNLRLN